MKKIKTWSGLGRSLVRRLCYRSTIGLAVVTFCAVLPLFSFGAFDYSDDLNISAVSLFTWTAYDATPSRLHVPRYEVYNYDEFYSVFSQGRWGFKINLKRSGVHYDYSVSLPLHGFAVTNPVSATSIGYCVNCQTNTGGALMAITPLFFPSVSSLYQSAATLFSLGYRGPGVQWFQSSGISSNFCVNVDYPVLVSDVLCSTNSVYRQILLSHLSTIQSAVVSIDSGVSALSPVLQDISSINSSIRSNTLSIADSSLVIVSNTSLIAENSLNISSNSSLLVSVSSNILSNTTLVVSNTSAIASNTSSIFDNTFSIAGSSAATASNSFATVSSLSSLDTKAGHIDDTTGSILGESSLIRMGTDNISTLAGFIGASLLGDPSNPNPSNPFAPFDPNDPSDPNHPSNPNSPWNKSSPNSVSGGGGMGAFTTNQVLRPLTNRINQASVEIQSNATAGVDRQIQNANDNWQEFKDIATGEGEGLNVKIKFPLWENDTYHVNVRDDSVVQAIQDNLHPVPIELNNIRDSIDWYKSNGVDVNLPSNLLSAIDELLHAITNRPHYLLLDDYGDYISNNVYSSAIETLRDEYPSVFTNLQSFGLSSSGDGNLWTLIGANLSFQSALVGSLLDDMATIRSFADEHIEGGFSEGVKSIIDRFPTSTQAEDLFNSNSNRLSEMEAALDTFKTDYHSVTSSASRIFRPFSNTDGDTVPDSLVFFKLPNEEYVTIPVKDQFTAWQTIRYGVSFAIVAVQFVLFPRFVLMIVLLFSKLSNRFVKFTPDQS